MGPSILWGCMTDASAWERDAGPLSSACHRNRGLVAAVCLKICFMWMCCVARLCDEALIEFMQGVEVTSQSPLLPQPYTTPQTPEYRPNKA